ncbi:UNVERIFIED_CONTAM: hypothetical protein PYX00_001445 [Menopon gallinae]|uniref:[acyl-carrier-protein] S-malonyltransferase n=1 Tax=Menopon gallinae TaxID=328185 RepID=A0AAW2ICV2_9NEOP
MNPNTRLHTLWSPSGTYVNVGEMSMKLINILCCAPHRKLITESRNMKLITALSKTIQKRYMCKEASIENIVQMRSNNLRKDLEAYCESPLKHFDDKQWATTAYPVGNPLKSKTNSENEADDDRYKSVIMFPGQGNQFVGMGKDLFTHSVVEDMFDSASSILGYNLKKLCLEGPKSKLDKTEYCQPATLVCSLAAVEELKCKYPLALSNCVCVCGFSVGEIAALVFAGCISFEFAVHLTRVRAMAMQACSEAVPSGMMSVLYGADSDLKGALEAARHKCEESGIENPVCVVANYLIPECKVIAGHDVGLDYIKNNAAKYKIRKVSRLPVSGAFHTILMKDAAQTFETSLKKGEIKNPIVPVISNVTAEPYNGTRDILKTLPKQIYKPVKWEQSMIKVYQRPSGTPFPHTYECGPGKTLTVLLKRINAAASRNCHNIFA